MPKETKQLTPLTENQLKLVQENLGLVAVHLRRNVCNPYTRHRTREWDDLFQEGCLGLIQAAIGYDPARGIPFAAFALPRIHNAVSTALHTRFNIIREPHTRSKRNRHAIDDEESVDKRRPKIRPLPIAADRLRMRPINRHHIDNEQATDAPRETPRETVGERLRDKYNRALQNAAEETSASHSVRGDRDQLVSLLVNERLTIPEEDHRRALRQIARDTRSSFARVSQTDDALISRTRQQLDDDPEFRHLYNQVRTRPDGCNAAIDDRMESELVSATIAEVASKFRSAAPAARADILSSLLSLDEEQIAALTHDRIAHMTAHERESFVREIEKAAKEKS